MEVTASPTRLFAAQPQKAMGGLRLRRKGYFQGLVIQLLRVNSRVWLSMLLRFRDRYRHKPVALRQLNYDFMFYFLF